METLHIIAFAMPGPMELIIILIIGLLIVAGLVSSLARSWRSRRKVREESEEESERRFPIKAILWSAFLLPVLVGIACIVYEEPESALPLILLALVLGFYRLGGPAPAGKSRSFSVSVLAKAVDLYRNHFFKLIAMSSLVSLPIMALFLILKIPRAFNHFITMYSLVMALVAVAVADTLSGEAISIFRAYRCALKRAVPLTLGVIATSMILSLTRWDGEIGWLFFFFSVWLAFVPQHAVVGHIGWRALIESRRLTRGYWWHVVGVLIVVHLGFPFICLFGLLAVGLAGMVFDPFQAVFTFLRELTFNFDENSLFWQIANILLMPFFGTIMAVCYYELRSHREGVTVEEIGRQTRALLDRKESRAKAVVNLGFVAVLTAFFLCLTIVPVSSLPASLPFYLGVWKWDFWEEARYVTETIRNDGLTHGPVGSRKSSWSSQLALWKLQYAYHRGISQPVVPESDGMVLVPAGDFPMGTAGGRGDENEQPEHTVYVDAYSIDQHEVTNAEYKRFLDATGHPAAVPRGR